MNRKDIENGLNSQELEVYNTLSEEEKLIFLNAYKSELKNKKSKTKKNLFSLKTSMSLISICALLGIGGYVFYTKNYVELPKVSMVEKENTQDEMSVSIENTNEDTNSSKDSKKDQKSEKESNTKESTVDKKEESVKEKDETSTNSSNSEVNKVPTAIEKNGLPYLFSISASTLGFIYFSKKIKEDLEG